VLPPPSDKSPTIAPSPKAKPAAPLNPVKITPAAAAQKRIEDEKFIQAIFAPAHQSPYAQALKIPDRFPTSTSKKQQDPLLRLKMANTHFHDSPIAHMKKKRPELFAERSVDLSVSSHSAFIPTSLSVTAPRSVSPPGQRGKRSGSPNSKTRTRGDAAHTSKSLSALPSGSKTGDKGAFFFPALLAAGTGDSSAAADGDHEISSEAKTDGGSSMGKSPKSTEKRSRLQIPNVPDIDVVGTATSQMDDFDFLRSILQ
jgi:hypothetical protein